MNAGSKILDHAGQGDGEEPRSARTPEQVLSLIGDSCVDLIKFYTRCRDEGEPKKFGFFNDRNKGVRALRSHLDRWVVGAHGLITFDEIDAYARASMDSIGVSTTVVNDLIKRIKKNW